VLRAFFYWSNFEVQICQIAIHCHLSPIEFNAFSFQIHHLSPMWYLRLRGVSVARDRQKISADSRKKKVTCKKLNDNVFNLIELKRIFAHCSGQETMWHVYFIMKMGDTTTVIILSYHTCLHTELIILITSNIPCLFRSTISIWSSVKNNFENDL